MPDDFRLERMPSMTPKYKYLTQRDVLRSGDEYHQFGAVWFLVSAEHCGKVKGAVCSHKTRVRRKVQDARPDLRAGGRRKT